jgi:hypothetical protein
METSTEAKGFILFKKDRAYFKRGIIGSTEIGKLKIRREEVLEYLRNTNTLSKIKPTKSGLWIYEEQLYKQLLVYAAGVSTMRNRGSLRILKLIEAISKLDEYSLHFWYAEFASRFKQGGLRGIGRVSRALRVLYGIDK